MVLEALDLRRDLRLEQWGCRCHRPVRAGGLNQALVNQNGLCKGHQRTGWSNELLQEGQMVLLKARMGEGPRERSWHSTDGAHKGGFQELAGVEGTVMVNIWCDKEKEEAEKPEITKLWNFSVLVYCNCIFMHRRKSKITQQPFLKW